MLNKAIYDFCLPGIFATSPTCCECSENIKYTHIWQGLSIQYRDSENWFQFKNSIAGWLGRQDKSENLLQSHECCSNHHWRCHNVKMHLLLSFFHRLSRGKFHSCLVVLEFVLLLFIHNCTANMLSFTLEEEGERQSGEKSNFKAC